MLKLFTQIIGLRQFEKIQTNIEHQKFGSVLYTFSKQISKKCYSQECKSKCIFLRKYLINDVIAVQVSPKTMTYVPFLEKIEEKKEEARRSIIVQVQSEQSFKELHAYCSSIGTVNQMFHYTTGIEPAVRYLNTFETHVLYFIK